MTEVRDKRSLFEQSPHGPAQLRGGGEPRRRPPPPPVRASPLSPPAAPNHLLGNGTSPSARPEPSAADKISKLSPALLKNLERANRSGGGLSPAVVKGGIAGARTPSPALKKKTKPAVKLQQQSKPAGSARESCDELSANKLGVGLLASVTNSASTGNLHSNSFSSSSSSSSSNRQSSSPRSVRVKSSSPQIAQKSRKMAALSMDVSQANNPPVRERPSRPFSTGGAHRLTPRVPAGRPLKEAPPSVPRNRNDSVDSFEDSFSPPPPSSSPAPQSSSSNYLAMRKPLSVVSRSTENLLEEKDIPVPKLAKPRSSSDVTSPPPSEVGSRAQRRRPPKPAPPPKKPELKALAMKPAPPPKPKPHLKQPRTSPDFSHRVSSHDDGARPSSRGTPAERSRSTSATSDPTSSPTPGKPRPFSPLLQRGGEVITSGLSPSTPSPCSSQLEVTQRNADSGFVSETPEEPSSPLEVWDEARVEKARNKRKHIAEELLSTEQTYVERLHVIAVQFHGVVVTFNSQNKNVIPEGDVNRIFLNIPQIYGLNTNILEALQERMNTWSTREGLGDVVGRLAPFLKLYAHYTAGFEDAMKLLTSWTKREKKFDTAVREFERELSGLGVAHYMLEPVQRIPRYRLLLTDYLKYTPPDSSDRLPTEKALEIISEAADHSNDRIKELENSNTILSIQRSLQDFEGTLLAPSRLFIRKGQLQKFSRKTTTPRMFFMFSDMLLHTEPTGTDVYRFKNEMPTFLMRVEEPVVSLVPHSFNVESTTRSLILVASSEAEKIDWMADLRKAIGEEMKKRASLRREMSIRVDSGVFGAQAPIMVPDKSVTMCQVCSAVFTFTFRRHHCRCCGKVVCGSCSQWKAYLRYLKKTERVCEKCHYTSKSESGEEVDMPPPSPMSARKKEGAGGILDVKGYEEDTIKGGYVLCQDGRKWNRLWYQLKQDFCLYKFKAHEDIKAISSLPLPGYIVNSDPVTHTITLTHPSSSKKELSDTFRLENPNDFDFWVLALESVVQLEVPSLPADTKLSPLPDERLRSQSLRDIDAVNLPEDSPLENSV